MRDPARIDRIIAKLRAYWHASPELRLAQIVGNAVGKPGDHYNVEDEVVEAGIPITPPPAAPLVLAPEEREALEWARNRLDKYVPRCSCRPYRNNFSCARHGEDGKERMSGKVFATLDRLLAASPSQPVAPATRSCSTGEACLIAGGCVPSRCLRADVATPPAGELMTVGAALMLSEVREGRSWIEASRPLPGGGTETVCFFIRDGDLINRYTDRWTALTLKDFDRPVRLVPAEGSAAAVSGESYCAQCFFNGLGKLRIVDGKCPNPNCVLLRYRTERP